MNKDKKSYVGKIGFCDNKTLGIKDENGNYRKGGHYVYIREMTGTDKCSVNVITSLVKENNKYSISKIDKVRRGMLYPIPKGDSNFTRWSAANLDTNIENIKISDIQNIGLKDIKPKHKSIINFLIKKK